MLAKPPEKLWSRKLGQLLFAFVFVVFVKEAHTRIIDVLNAVVAYCHPMSVLSQIFYNLLRVAQRRFAIHHPRLSPGIVEQGLILGQLIALFELPLDLFEHLAPEHGTKHMHRVKVFALFANSFHFTFQGITDGMGQYNAREGAS